MSDCPECVKLRARLAELEAVLGAAGVTSAGPAESIACRAAGLNGLVEVEIRGRLSDVLLMGSRRERPGSLIVVPLRAVVSEDRPAVQRWLEQRPATELVWESDEQQAAEVAFSVRQGKGQQSGRRKVHKTADSFCGFGQQYPTAGHREDEAAGAGADDPASGGGD